MKILQVNKLYLPTIGGIETVVEQIAEGLNRQTEMQVLVCREKGKAIEEQYNGIDVVRARSSGVFKSMPISLDFFVKFRLMSLKKDIVLLHSPFPLADLALLLFNCNAKVVVWWHSDIIRQKILGTMLTPIINHTLRRAELIIVATDGHIKSSRFLSKYSGKCRIISFGLNFQDYPEPDNKSFLSGRLKNKSNKKLLFVGRLVYYKGIQILLEAMREVTGTELFVVGDGALRKESEDFVKKHNLSSSVHFMGYLPRKDLLAALYDCDIFVFPSVANSEAFGLVQLEAMFYGKPVINTNLPTGVPYVSVGGETGLTVKVGDPGELAEAITTLAEDEALRALYGKSAAERVRQNFNIKDMLYELYGEFGGLLKV